jgi:hypothetical protein
MTGAAQQGEDARELKFLLHIFQILSAQVS